MIRRLVAALGVALLAAVSLTETSAGRAALIAS